MGWFDIEDTLSHLFVQIFLIKNGNLKHLDNYPYKLGFWVGFFMNIFQFFYSVMGVDLSSSKACMT